MHNINAFCFRHPEKGIFEVILKGTFFTSRHQLLFPRRGDLSLKKVDASHNLFPRDIYIKVVISSTPPDHFSHGTSKFPLEERQTSPLPKLHFFGGFNMFVFPMFFLWIPMGIYIRKRPTDPQSLRSPPSLGALGKGGFRRIKDLIVWRREPMKRSKQMGPKLTLPETNRNPHATGLLGRWGYVSSIGGIC